MKIEREFQPIHITIETKDDLTMFQNILYNYITKSPARFTFSFKELSEHDKKVQALYEYLERK